MGAESRAFFAPRAWVAGAWADDVLLSVDAQGLWCGVEAGAPPEDRRGATVLPGPVVPGLVDAHSHAFQRAIAGLTERLGGAGPHASDDFWSWRDRMYSAALRVTPAQFEAIAAMLYAELLDGGYTHVCEFHYLHNDTSGRAYADPMEMSLALLRAARRTGIGLTLLPTLYMRSGFGAAGLRADQRRFASTPESVLGIARRVRAEAGPGGLAGAGVALHSLRAVDEAALREVAAAAREEALPVHIHIAEQTQEVDDCVAHTGARPIEWLLAHAPVDARWNLVHATHTTPAELQGVATSGAAVVVCPSTEANLGDGVFDLPGFAAVGGRWSVGSDSHVTRHAFEELRLLEYSQRLALRRRNVAAQASRPATAAVLFEAALAGGMQATAAPVGGIAPGRRADFAVLDAESPALLGVPHGHLLDALVFSSPAARLSQVWVAGRRVAGGDARGGERAAIARDFTRAMGELWAC